MLTNLVLFMLGHSNFWKKYRWLCLQTDWVGNPLEVNSYHVACLKLCPLLFPCSPVLRRLSCEWSGLRCLEEESCSVVRPSPALQQFSARWFPLLCSINCLSHSLGVETKRLQQQAADAFPEYCLVKKMKRPHKAAYYMNKDLIKHCYYLWKEKMLPSILEHPKMGIWGILIAIA